MAARRFPARPDRLTALPTVADNVPMRRMIVGPTVLAVLFAFWGSPFFHLHAASVKAHHRGAAVEFDHETLIHAHLPLVTASHASDTLSGTEEGEEPLDIFRAVIPASAAVGVALPFLAPARVIVTPPVVSSTCVFVRPLPRTHDPPSLSRLIPRAPPA
jgi:hypothetical protein